MEKDGTQKTHKRRGSAFYPLRTGLAVPANSNCTPSTRESVKFVGIPARNAPCRR